MLQYIKSVMKYIEKILGIKTKYIIENIVNMPNFINDRYELKVVYLDTIKTIFVYPLCELDNAKMIKKHIELIEEANKCNAVLILSSISFKQRESYIREKISFIMENKQIYIPFLGTYLSNSFVAEKQVDEKIYPATQLLLLHFIYNGCIELQTTKAAKELGVSLMSISRAVSQLKNLKLIKTKKQGYKELICSNKTPKELFELSIPYLLNPIKKKIYILAINEKEGLYISGYSALTEYSSISSSAYVTYASGSISKYAKEASNHRYSDELEVEFWRYDPKKLSNNGIVDPLSLYLSLKDEIDERTQGALEEMLNDLWEGIDGKRIRNIQKTV